jgi:hypothetical protein
MQRWRLHGSGLRHGSNPLNIAILKKRKLLKWAPMTINNIPDENYRIIKDLGGINGRYTVN